MWKILAVIAVVFSVAQAPVPVTGQTPNNDRSETNPNHAETGTGDTQTNPIPAIGPKSPESSHPKVETGKESSVDTQDSVTIIESTTVPSKRDWVDYTTLGIGIVIAVITGAGVIAAWRGLPQLFRQAASAKIAADAARESADALISAERAWVLASIRKTVTPFPYTSMIAMPDIVKCEFVFKNYGATPAIIESYSIDANWPLPEPEFPLPPKYEKTTEARIILGPGEDRVVGSFPPDPNFTLELSISWGYVNYGGIFEGERDREVLLSI